MTSEEPASDELVWRRIDLHLHTPASSDYQQPNASYLDILLKAEERGLNLISFTDHNSVRGYADLWREIEDLELLEYLGRINGDEQARLNEYRRLLVTIVLLPGFEFTATFGFHILAIFPETTTVRKLEHLLLTLGVAEEKFGRGEVGATADVLAAYRLLGANGALVIGAHANSTNGIAMQGLRFGGQTKIAYTQDPSLHALEVTDLDTPANRRSTARFFNGSKAEYPRRMHTIQGSDAHRLDTDPLRPSHLGIGERATEVLLSKVSFQSLKDLFASDEFERTRPARPLPGQGDLVKQAREAGANATQAFHEHLTTKKSGVSHVLRDIVAFANTGGGTVFVGASPSEKRPIAGVDDPRAAEMTLRDEVARQITPSPPFTTETLHSDAKPVLMIRVNPGLETPYVLVPGLVLVRRNAESAPAGRDEIVAMVRRAASHEAPAAAPLSPVGTPGANGAPVVALLESSLARPVEQGETESALAPSKNGAIAAALPAENSHDRMPKTGVEIVAAVDANGVTSYTMRDLRTLEETPRVTRGTSRRLWRYAIEQREGKAVEEGHIRWKGDRGFWKLYRPRGGEPRYNLALRDDGRLRMFYGVTFEGMDNEWRAVVPLERDHKIASTRTGAPDPPA